MQILSSQVTIKTPHLNTAQPQKSPNNSISAFIRISGGAFSIDYLAKGAQKLLLVHHQ